MTFDIEHLKNPADREVIYLPQIDSTSSELARRLKAGSKPKTVVIADRQTSGRGRLGRSWHSNDFGNLYLSLAVDVNEPVEKLLPILPLVAGLCVARTIRKMCGIEATIKWPNDLLVNNKKLAGILCEMPNPQKRPAIAIVGLGVNISTENFPDELSSIATSLRLLRVTTAPEEIATVWINDFEREMARLRPENVKNIIDNWRTVAEPFGRRVCVGGMEGETVNIANDGCLVLKTTLGKEVSLIGGIVEYQDF